MKRLFLLIYFLTAISATALEVPFDTCGINDDFFDDDFFEDDFFGDDHGFEDYDVEPTPIIDGLPSVSGIECIKAATNHGDPCACSEDFKNHEKIFGDFDEETKKVKAQIKKEQQRVAEEAVSKKTLTIIQAAMKLDVDLKTGGLSETSYARAPSCNLDSLYSSLTELSRDENCKADIAQSAKNIFKNEGKDLQESIDIFKGKIGSVASANNSNQANSSSLPLHAYFRMNQNNNSCLRLPTVYRDSEGFDSPYVGSPYPLARNASLVDRSDFEVYKNVLENSELAFVNVQQMTCQRDELLLGLISRPPLSVSASGFDNERNDARARQVVADEALLSASERFSSLSANIRASQTGLMTERENDIKKENEAIEQFLAEDETKNLAIAILEEDCRKTFKVENLKQYLCQETPQVSKATTLAQVLPNILKDMSDTQIEEEAFFLAKASYEMYCKDSGKYDRHANRINKNSEAIYDPMGIPEPQLAGILDGTSEEFNSFQDRMRESVLSATREGGGLDTEAARSNLVDSLMANYESEMLQDPSLTEEEKVDLRERARNYFGSVVADPDQPTVEFWGGEADINQARAIAGYLEEVDRTTTDDGGQPLVAETFGERPEGETGIFTSYTTRADGDEVRAAETIRDEYEAARRENREPDPQVIAANRFNPRDLTTGAPVSNPSIAGSPTNSGVFSPRDAGGDNAVARGPAAIATPTPSRDTRGDSRLTNNDSSSSTSSQTTSRTRSSSESRREERTVERSSQRQTSERDTSSPDSLYRDTVAERRQQIKDQIAETEERISRTQREIEKAREERKNGLREQITRDRNRLDDLRRSDSQRISRSSPSPQTNGGPLFSPPSSGRYNAFTDPRGEDSFPRDYGSATREPASIPQEEGKLGAGSTRATSKAGKSGKKGTKGSSNGASGGKGGKAGLVNGGKVKGFEGAKITSCDQPTLVYQFPCEIKVAVFDEYNSVYPETDEKGLVKEKRYRPSEFVESLGLEGKTFFVSTPFTDENQKQKYKIVTYDWYPKMLEDVGKMNSVKWRSEKLSEILANRWDVLYIQEIASQTHAMDEPPLVLSKKRYEEFLSEKEINPLTMDIASDLQDNVSLLNSRVIDENPDKVEEMNRIGRASN